MFIIRIIVKWECHKVKDKLLVLSFIGAIVDLAREQYKKENKSAFEEGGIYPLSYGFSIWCFRF